MFTVRQEFIHDYDDIAELTAQAFGKQDYIGEVALIDSIRRNHYFDSELSLVALDEEKIVGHVMFLPQISFLEGEEVPSVILGPIAVLPEYQKIGVGKLLIQEGHRIAYKKGYKFSFLWGHPSYYPKFGYMTNMFGEAIVKINVKDIVADVDLNLRRIEKKDTPILYKMWENWFKDINLAIKPSKLLLDWISNYTNITAHIVEKDNEIIGYIRYEKGQLDKVKMFLAKDKESTELMIKYIKKNLNTDSITLPLYETKYIKDMLEGFETEFHNETWKACMISILDEDNDAINAYCQDVISLDKKPGQIILPPCYEME